MSKSDRLKIWRVLSDLFLDTEINEITYGYTAKTVQESEFSVAEVETILWHEVYPVLEGNLLSVAGEWACWPDDWLLENLNICEEPGVITGNPAIIKECWSKVVAMLLGTNA